MWVLKLTTQFKKDLKRYKHRKKELEELRLILAQLELSGSVSASYRPHKLSGKYADCMECHVMNDFLLIWIDTESSVISLVRLGTHSELFR